MSENDSYWELAELNPDAILYPEFDEAYIGWVARGENEPPVACYLYDAILSVLLEETMYEVMQEKEFETIFPNTKKEIFEYNNKHDPHGQSTEKDIVFIFDDGSEAGIACLDWGEKYTKQNNAEDHMQVFLDTKGYADWLKGPAYK